MSEAAGKVIRVCGIEPESIVDGPGFRYVVFVQGCPHHCHGCHNPESWAFDAGCEMTTGEIFEEIKERPNLRGVTFSGGEPFLQVSELARTINEIALLTGKKPPVICYTGNTKEGIEERNDAAAKALLSLTDLLIDGEYIQELDSNDRYKGSDNQRMIFLTDRFSPEDFPPMKRSISIRLGSDHLAMSGIPTASQAETWKNIKKEW